MKFLDFIKKIISHFPFLALLTIPFGFDFFVVKNLIKNAEISYFLKITIYVVCYLFCFCVVLVISLHIPRGKKGKYNICLMIVSYNIFDDTKLIKHGVISSYENLFQSREDIFIVVPNVLSRYFFNQWCINYPFIKGMRYWLLRLLTWVNRCDLILFGQFESVTNRCSTNNSIRINTFTPLHIKDTKEPFNKLVSSFNKTELSYDSNEELSGTNKIAKCLKVITYCFLSFYYNEQKDYIKSLDISLNILDEIELYDEVGNGYSALKEIINALFLNISYTDVESISKYINLCKKYLTLFPKDTDVLLELQYYNMLEKRINKCSFQEFWSSTHEMLECLEKIDCIDHNHPAILANKAYLNLLSHNGTYAITLYDELFSLPDNVSQGTMLEIYQYYKDVEEDSFEYEYARFAYAYYNYFKNTSQEMKKNALTIFQSLVETASDDFIFQKANQILEKANKTKVA